jgi:flavin reductase (DIM6/NTAB) family NADH-FMN oxidoreductase RutF
MDVDAIDRVLRLVDREVWVVTAAAGKQRGGLLATWVSQGSVDREHPVLIAGIAPNHFTAELIEQSGRFVAHLLRADQAELAYHFASVSGRSCDKLAGLALEYPEPDLPTLADCLAWCACQVFIRYDAGDRLFFWADVVLAGEVGSVKPLREQAFIRSLTDDQRKRLAADRQADVALQRPLHNRWRASMSERFEYKFVRLDQTKVWLTSTPTPASEALEGYQQVVHEHAKEGWRLVQIFAPGLGYQGAASYFELVFERPVAS